MTALRGRFIFHAYILAKCSRSPATMTCGSEFIREWPVLAIHLCRLS